MGTELTKSNQKEPLKHYITRNKGIDHNKSMELRERGLSYPDIAKIQGCSTTNIYNVLQSWGCKKERVEEYKGNRGDILAGMQVRIIDSIKDVDIKKAPFGSRVLAVAQLYDKERIERGLSTDNVSVHVVEAEAVNLDDEIAKLRLLRGQLVSGSDNGTDTIK